MSNKEKRKIEYSPVLVRDGEQIGMEDVGRVQEGDIYAVGCGKRGYYGFVMPSETKVSRNGHVRISAINVYHVPDEGCAGRVFSLDVDLDDIAFEHLGVFRLREGTKLRRTIEENLTPKREEKVA